MSEQNEVHFTQASPLFLTHLCFLPPSLTGKLELRGIYDTSGADISHLHSNFSWPGTYVTPVVFGSRLTVVSSKVRKTG